MPQVVLKPSLNALRRQVRAFDSSTLVKQCAALQLLPENAHVLELLESACSACLLDWDSKRERSIHADVERLLQSPAFNGGMVAKLDDPHEHFFTSYFTYQGGNHVVFPGPTLGGTRPLEAVVSALEHQSEDFDSTFYTQSSQLISGVLKLSSHLAQAAGLKANTVPAGMHRDEPERTRCMPLITCPAAETLEQLAGACTLSTQELKRILTSGELQAVWSHLSLPLSGLQSALKRRPTDALKHHPIVAFDDQWLVLAPHSLLAAATRNILRQLQDAGQCGPFDAHLAKVQHLKTQLALARLGCQSLLVQEELATPPQTLWYALDTDKILSVTNIMQSAVQVDTTTLTGNWRPVIPALPPCAPDPVHAPHVLHLLVMCDLGDGYRAPLPRAWTPEQVVILRPDDLETLAAAYRDDSTVLWRLQRSRLALRQEIKLRIDNPIDEVALISKWDFPRSFPFQKGSLLLVNGQTGADWRRSVHAPRHAHVVPWIDQTTLIPVERDAQMLPAVYFPTMPVWSHEHVLVEWDGQILWVLDERGHDAWGREWSGANLEAGQRVAGGDETLDPVFEFLSGLVQGLAVWLTHLLPALQGSERLPDDGTVALWVGAEVQTQPCHVTVDSAGRSMRLTLAPSFVPLLFHADNRAERMLIRALAAALIRLNGRPAGAARIDQILGKVAPPGDKRLFVRHSSFHNTQLDPRGLVPVRYARPGEQHEWAVSVGRRMTQRHGWKPGQVLPTTSQIPIEANTVLYEELQSRLALLDGELLLRFLLEHHEAVRFDQEQLLTTRVSRELIFGSGARPFHPSGEGTAVALRFLLEVVAAKLPTGDLLPSLTLLDELMGLVILMTHYGHVGDAIKYGVGTVDIRLEGDSSLTMTADGFSRAMMALRDRGLWQGAIRANRERYEELEWPPEIQAADEQGASPTQTVMLQQIELACQALYGLTSRQLVRFMIGAMNIGDAHEGGVILLPVEQFVREIQADTGWTQEDVLLALDALSLRERADFLKPPDGLPASEVVPWQFNRALSLLKRPFIQTTLQGAPHVVWGNRALDSSRRFWLEDQLFAGRLYLPSGHPAKRGTVQAAKAMQTLSRLRGEAFNLEVAVVLQEAHYHVLQGVDRFGKLKLREGEDPLGDIDVFAWSEERRQVLVVECKAYAPARTPLELHYQLEEFVTGKVRKGRGPQRPLLERHLRRAKFVEVHLQDILAHLGLQERGGWRVEPIYVMSNFPNELLKEQAPYPVFYLEELSDLAKMQ